MDDFNQCRHDRERDRERYRDTETYLEESEALVAAQDDEIRTLNARITALHDRISNDGALSDINEELARELDAERDSHAEAINSVARLRKRIDMMADQLHKLDHPRSEHNAEEIRLSSLIAAMTREHAARVRDMRESASRTEALHAKALEDCSQSFRRSATDSTRRALERANKMREEFGHAAQGATTTFAADTRGIQRVGRPAFVRHAITVEPRVRGAWVAATPSVSFAGPGGSVIHKLEYTATPQHKRKFTRADTRDAHARIGDIAYEAFNQHMDTDSIYSEA